MSTDFITEKNEESERLHFATVLKQAIDSRFQELRVCMPAIVEEYDHKKQMAKVRPVFKRQLADGKTSEMPLISNVPIAWPRAGGAFIHLPLEKGHYVLLSIADRSLDTWLTNGGQIDPNDSRSHDLSDAIAHAGCYPFSDPASVANATDIILKNTDGDSAFTEVRLKKNGHFQIINQEYEFVKVLCQVMDYISEAVIYTDSGPQTLKHAFLRKEMAKLKTFLEK